jgi:hypothetical protein
LEANLRGPGLSEEKKRNVPTWMKVVIGAVSLLLGLLLGLAIVVGGFLLKENDPNYKKNVAMSIAEFPETLPAGFSFGTARDMQNVRTVLLNHSPEQMDISISEINVDDPNMKKALDLNFDLSADSSAFEEKDKGTLKIAGHTLEYKTGLQTRGSKKIATLDGRVTDIPDKFISIKAFSNGAGPFDLPLFKMLTDSIKSLPPILHH